MTTIAVCLIAAVVETIAFVFMLVFFDSDTFSTGNCNDRGRWHFFNNWLYSTSTSFVSTLKN